MIKMMINNSDDIDYTKDHNLPLHMETDAGAELMPQSLCQ